MEHCHAAMPPPATWRGRNSWWRACAGSGSSESSKFIKGVSSRFPGEMALRSYAQKRAKEHMFCTHCMLCCR